jgi:dihydrofolate reductase
MTGRITIDLFTTLDGVAQAPGGPDEDPSGGFPWGGWQAPLPAYWPLHTDNPIGRRFAEIPKYVASRSTLRLDWPGAQQLGPDAAAAVAALRDRHEDIHVIGSIDFVQSLLAAEAYDELNLWVYPVVLGQGKKVFPDGAAPANLRLIAPPITGGTAVQLRYAPSGVPTTGEMGPEQ